MRFSSILALGLLTTSVSAARGKKVRRQEKPDNPTAPDITPKCTYYDTWVDDDLDCLVWLDDWALTLEEFREYNPSIGDNCSGIKVGYSYCIEINNGRPEEPGMTSTEDAEPEPTEDPQPEPAEDLKPSPTQEGLIDTCTSFYKAKKGDTCAKIISQYKAFDFETFFQWNPAVESDCSGIWANTWYCVGIPGTPTSPPTRTAESTSKPTGEDKPSPTQEGLIESCIKFHAAAKGDTCAKIISSFGTFDFATFFKWNPAVGKDCSGIWAGYYYCVGVPGTLTAKPSATGGDEIPSPVQEGIAKNCNKWHMVAKTTTCSSIEKHYSLPFAQFVKWNPAVEKDCSGLWAGYWVCVSVEGYKPATTTAAKPTTTKPVNGIETPEPIQNGMVKNCDKFHKIKSTTTCASIENYYNLPLATFLSWNPAIGEDCKHLLTGYSVCVGTVGWKPPTRTTTNPAAITTRASNGITTPLPIQPKMASNCNKFHLVKKTTTCDSIQNYFKISLADFVKWNPAVGSNCNSLWADYNVCVGVIGSTPTKPDNSVKTPTPIQPGIISNCKTFHKVASTTTCASIQKYYSITMAQLAKWNPAIGIGCTALWRDYWVCVGVEQT